MRSLLVIILGFSFQAAMCQDWEKIKAIDSLVKGINSSGLNTTTDTIINDMPAMGLYFKTLASVTFRDSDVVKYSNNVLSITSSPAKKDTLNAITVFYFDKGKLVKVEDSGVSKEGVLIKADWYYRDDEPLYHIAENIKDEKAEFRANQLLFIAKTMQEQYHKR